MKQWNLNHLDLTVYEKTLPNGLTVYVVPKEDKNGIYATFTTKFGSNIREFCTADSKKMKKVPLGVAHFLEHQMFEQADGVDPMKYFEDRGAMTNAATSNQKTTYLFSGPDYFKENITYLLDFVQSPYMTEETVEKEKGIILQELAMYQNNPYFKLYTGSLAQSFIKHPVKYPVLGTKEEIEKTTKEDLYECYNAFYHPSNMFVTVVGNVNYEEVFDIIQEHQKDKVFPDAQEIIVKKYSEPEHCKKEFTSEKADVVIPKISLNYKMNLQHMEGIELKKFLTYTDILFNLKFGMTSTFSERMLEEGILTEDIEISYIRTEDHVLYMFEAETKDPERLLKEIKTELKDLEISKEDLERKKRAYWSAFVYMTDNIRAINQKIVGNVVAYHRVIDDDYNEIKSLNVLEMKKYMKYLNFNHCNVYMLEPKEISE